MVTPLDASLTPLLLTLPSLTPSLALEVLPLGLTLHRLFVQADGKAGTLPSPLPRPLTCSQTHDILIGPELPAGHLTQKYTNTIIGRYANRVPAGTHPVSRAGVHSSLTAASNESPSVSLHGGLSGWDLAPWDPLPDLSAATLFSPDEQQTIAATLPSACVFVRESPNGEEGYPGRLRVEVLVGLAQSNAPPPAASAEWLLGSVVLIYRARLLDTDKVTPINLTQHWGFNLDASLQDGQSVKDHTLTIRVRPHPLPPVIQD
ncbi:predicted protein [Postia placenta Mad-698-R]|nr:predicted protein [Postia placenta Mad-698-R]